MGEEREYLFNFGNWLCCIIHNPHTHKSCRHLAQLSWSASLKGWAQSLNASEKCKSYTCSLQMDRQYYYNIHFIRFTLDISHSVRWEGAMNQHMILWPSLIACITKLTYQIGVAVPRYDRPQYDQLHRKPPFSFVEETTSCTCMFHVFLLDRLIWW